MWAPWTGRKSEGESFCHLSTMLSGSIDFSLCLAMSPRRHTDPDCIILSWVAVAFQWESSKIRIWEAMWDLPWYWLCCLSLFRLLRFCLWKERLGLPGRFQSEVSWKERFCVQTSLVEAISCGAAWHVPCTQVYEKLGKRSSSALFHSDCLYPAVDMHYYDYEHDDCHVCWYMYIKCSS